MSNGSSNDSGVMGTVTSTAEAAVDKAKEIGSAVAEKAASAVQTVKDTAASAQKAVAQRAAIVKKAAENIAAQAKKAVTPKPNSSPSRVSEAASPIRPRPKRKSAPTQTWRAPKQSRSSFSAKSRSLDWESAASKPTSNTSSTPSSASALARCAALCRRKGGALG